MLDEMLTFEIEYEDGTVEQKTIPMTFDDVPDPVIAGLLLLKDEDRVAALLSFRLDVPLEAAERLVGELLRGEGVRVA